VRGFQFPDPFLGFSAFGVQVAQRLLHPGGIFECRFGVQFCSLYASLQLSKHLLVGVNDTTDIFSCSLKFCETFLVNFVVPSTGIGNLLLQLSNSPFLGLHATPASQGTPQKGSDIHNSLELTALALMLGNLLVQLRELRLMDIQLPGSAKEQFRTPSAGVSLLEFQPWQAVALTP
jgi:hypothetical protein